MMMMISVQHKATTKTKQQNKTKQNKTQIKYTVKNKNNKQ